MTPTTAGRGPGYLDDAERHTGRRLACRAELEAMVGAAAEPELAQDFERALFLARFWEGAVSILRRTGPDAAEVVPLTSELAAAVSEVSAIVARLLAAGKPERAGEYAAKYRPSDLGGMERLSVLLSDLASLKGFELRGGGR